MLIILNYELFISSPSSSILFILSLVFRIFARVLAGRSIVELVLIVYLRIVSVIPLTTIFMRAFSPVLLIVYRLQT